MSSGDNPPSYDSLAPPVHLLWEGPISITRKAKQENA